MYELPWKSFSKKIMIDKSKENFLMTGIEYFKIEKENPSSKVKTKCTILNLLIIPV